MRLDEKRTCVLCCLDSNVDRKATTNNTTLKSNINVRAMRNTRDGVSFVCALCLCEYEISWPYCVAVICVRRLSDLFAVRLSAVWTTPVPLNGCHGRGARLLNPVEFVIRCILCVHHYLRVTMATRNRNGIYYILYTNTTKHSSLQKTKPHPQS